MRAATPFLTLRLTLHRVRSLEGLATRRADLEDLLESGARLVSSDAEARADEVRTLDWCTRAKLPGLLYGDRQLLCPTAVQLSRLLEAATCPRKGFEWRHALAVAAASEELLSALLDAVTLVPAEPPFPAEHLAAVFLPMWMPLAAPLLSGLMQRRRVA